MSLPSTREDFYVLNLPIFLYLVQFRRGETSNVCSPVSLTCMHRVYLPPLPTGEGLVRSLRRSTEFEKISLLYEPRGSLLFVVL